MLKEIGKKALLAAEELKTIDTDTKNKVLNDMASELIDDADEIIDDSVLESIKNYRDKFRGEDV